MAIQNLNVTASSERSTSSAIVFERVPHFRDVLREVETDPTGIFLG